MITETEAQEIKARIERQAQEDSFKAQKRREAYLSGLVADELLKKAKVLKDGRKSRTDAYDVHKKTGVYSIVPVWKSTYGNR